VSIEYKVVFEGGLLPGHNQSEAQARLAGLFSISMGSAAQLFSGKQRKVKGNLDLKQANLYVRALLEHGVFAYIEEENELGEVPDVAEEAETARPEEDRNPYETFFEQQEDMQDELQEELTRTGRYELMGEDELDEQLGVMNTGSNTLTGVMSIMTPEQAAKMRSELIKDET